MTIPTITTGTLAAGYALDAASVTTATTSASISVPVGSMLLIAAATQYGYIGGPSITTPTFNGNSLTVQVSSPAGSTTHGDWNGGGFWSWQNSGGSTVTGTITVPTSGGTPQRLRMRAWIISGHSTSTPFQTVTAANVVNTNNGAADPALMPASGTLTAQVDGVLFLLGLDFGSTLSGSSLASVTDEYEMVQADNNYWVSGYSVAASPTVSGSWTRGNTNGYKFFGLVLNPAVSGTPPTPSTPTISSVTATSTTASATLTLLSEGRTSVSVRYGTNGTTWTTVTGSANQTAFSITGLTANTVYLLQAKATNSAATVPDSAWSSSFTFGTENPVSGTGDLSSTPSSAPTGLIVTNVTTTSATLGCDAYGGALSYDWQYGTTSGSYSATANTATPSDPLTGLTSATIYYWRVRAVGTLGPGPWSGEQSFSTIPAVSPTGMTTTNITTTGATLNCDAVTGAVSYDWRIGSASGVYGASTNTTTTYNAITSLSSGTNYYWQVRAVTAGGAGPWCSEQTFATAAVVSAAATTSGTSSSNLDLNDLIEEAYERCGLEMRGGYEFRTARRSLNLLTIEWANRGINLWTVEQGSISLTQGTATYDLPGDTIDLIDHVVRTGASQSQVDININRISGSTYATIPNKNATGRPIQVWINRQSGATYPSGTNNPKINVWPTPDRSSYYTFVYWRLRRIQDAGRGGAAVQDIPFRFLPCLVAGLAYYLGGKVAGMDQNRLAMLKAEYEQQFQLAADEDREKAPNRFVPRLR